MRGVKKRLRCRLIAQPGLGPPVAKGEKQVAQDVVTCLSLSIVVVSLNAAECEYATQLVPDAIISTALLVGKAAAHLFSVTPIIV